MEGQKEGERESVREREKGSVHTLAQPLEKGHAKQKQNAAKRICSLCCQA